MKTDIIIPVYKPGKELFALLDRLETQSVPVHEIIIMNTEEQYFHRLTEGMKFEEKYPNVRVYHVTKREFDHGGTRHQAVQYSKGDVFLCMTQDAMPADRFLVERLTENLNGNTAAAYARQLPGPDSSEFEKVSRYFNYPETSVTKTAADLEKLGIKTFFCSNVCAAYRRDIYDRLGGFVRPVIFNEDMIYAAGAVMKGYAIVYEAKAQVVHSHNYSNLAQLRRNFDMGVSQADHPEVFGAAASESEGIRLVKETWNYLRRKKRLHCFPRFCLQCCFKYAGYILGKQYRRLPRKWILKITGNREFWNHHFTITS